MSAPRRILVVAPHPDDEALGAGGLLAAAADGGAAVRIIFLTNGEGNTLGHMRWKRRLFISAADELAYGEERKAEARAAAALLPGAETEFCGYCDTGLFELLADGGNAVTSELERRITEYAPDLVICPSRLDRHRDHSAAALMTDFALARLSFPPERVLRFVNHGAALAPAGVFSGPGRLTPRQLEMKRTLLDAYASQVSLHRNDWEKRCSEGERYAGGADGDAPEFTPEFSGPDLVWLRTSFSPSRLNPAALYIVGAGGAGTRRCYFVRLKRRGRLRLREFSGRAAGDIEVQPRRGGGCYLKLQRRLFPDCDRFYIKARRKLSFFDDSGFSRIPLAPPERGEPRTAAVMPCYNIAAQAAETAARCLRHADTVIAVDDGSSDGTSDALERVAVGPGGARLKVIKLPRNVGKGGALAAGVAEALASDFDLVVTIDGDLQHRPEDIPRFRAAWRDGADLIVGRRAFCMDAPLRSRLGNNVINWLAARLLPNSIADTQSGFRGFNRRLAEALFRNGKTGKGRYEAELVTLLSALRKDSRTLELDIPAIYLDRNRTSHFKPLTDSARIILVLLAQFITQ